MSKKKVKYVSDSDSSEIISSTRLTMSLKELLTIAGFLITVGFFGGLAYSISQTVSEIKEIIKITDQRLDSIDKKLSVIETKVNTIDQVHSVEIMEKLRNIDFQLQEKLQ